MFWHQLCFEYTGKCRSMFKCSANETTCSIFVKTCVGLSTRLLLYECFQCHQILGNQTISIHPFNRQIKT